MEKLDQANLTQIINEMAPPGFTLPPEPEPPLMILESEIPADEGLELYNRYKARGNAVEPIITTNRDGEWTTYYIIETVTGTAIPGPDGDFKGQPLSYIFERNGDTWIVTTYNGTAEQAADYVHGKAHEDWEDRGVVHDSRRRIMAAIPAMIMGGPFGALFGMSEMYGAVDSAGSGEHKNSLIGQASSEALQAATDMEPEVADAWGHVADLRRRAKITYRYWHCLFRPLPDTICGCRMHLPWRRFATSI